MIMANANEDRVRQRAYEVWEAEGSGHGCDRERWEQGPARIECAREHGHRGGDDGQRYGRSG